MRSLKTSRGLVRGKPFHGALETRADRWIVLNNPVFFYVEKRQSGRGKGAINAEQS
jgi:hypothetical protein